MARRLPPLHSLIAFEAAARLGRMTEAASELCVTPGAVSRQVKKLEESLGVALFEGTKNRPLLTSAGQALAPQLSLAFDHLHSAVQAVAVQNSNVIQVACYNTLAAKWLLPRLPQLTALHPLLEVQINALTQADEKLLRTHDAVLVAQPTDALMDSVVLRTILFPETLGPVMSAQLYESMSIHKPRDILKLPLLQTCTRTDAWEIWLQAHGLAWPASKQKGATQPFQHYYFSLEAALRGQGVCVAPAHLVMDDLAAGRLVAPLGFVPSGWQYVLLTAPSPKPMVKKFADWLLVEAKWITL
jgi:LysR family transcriptional regulator, glycine cleavage system transcriptional activator